MIKKLILLISISLLGLFSASTMAANSISECEKQTDVNKVSSCLDIVIGSIDRELQTWINNQTFNLEELAIKTGRQSALAMFKRSQNDFIRYRENNCRWQYLAISPDIQASTIYKKCYIIVTKNRINELSQLN
jgi:uncharacterized protein YecT (DUF1311 family)